MTVIHTFEALYFLPTGISFAIVGIILTVVSALTLYHDKFQLVNLKVTGMLIGIFTFFIFVALCGLTETRYQIIIDENTSFAEVQEKYEIIEQKGISYIVKDIKKE